MQQQQQQRDDVPSSSNTFTLTMSDQLPYYRWGRGCDLL